MKTRPSIVLLALLSACGSHAPVEVSVRALDGQQVTLFQGREDAYEVLLFVAPDCPIANKYAPELQRIGTEYGARGVGFHLVYTDADVDVEAIRAHKADFRLTLPTLLDFDHRLVELSGATVTPEAALFSPSGELLYLGRVDDRFVDFGKEREGPTRTDLRDALDAVLDGRKPERARIEAIGCFIPDRAESD